MFKRKQHFQGLGSRSCFLWGARQTGKSTLLQEAFPKAITYDLLKSDVYERLASRPFLLREELVSAKVPRSTPVIIDEVQKIPALLDEVHWLIVNQKKSFILSGSSPRKLKRGGANLLGGRALRYELYPLVSAEIPHFDLLKALRSGLLPEHYLAKQATPLLKAYIGDYLNEEIAAEARSRNIPAFSRFLEAAAFSNGEMVNYQNIARDTGVSSVVVKEYFQILEDTLLGYWVPSYQKRPKRRVIQAPKFYFFDLGLTNTLVHRGEIQPRSELFGKVFEHFIFQELKAHSHYSGQDYTVSYWRTASQYEVDFILGDHEIAIEVKSTDSAHEGHWKGLKAFQEEYEIKRSILVSMDPRPRKVGSIEVLPWKDFLNQLWSGQIL